MCHRAHSKHIRNRRSRRNLNIRPHHNNRPYDSSP